MFDPNADPAVVISEIYRECYRRAVEKVRSHQIGLAWIDIQIEQEPFRLARAA